jgi:monosaccharide ABC transporter substrate-binding protein, CUT2 family (TC 3.A.1.2.-)
MGNPFFVALATGATDKAKEVNPNVEVTALGYDYDMNKQFTQIDNFIAAGVDLILLNPADPQAVAPAIARAQAAGIPVVAVDTAAEGADATVTTDNVQAGEIACQYIVDKLGGKGDVVIRAGEPVIGKTIPFRTFDAFYNGKITTINLDDYRGKWIILFFYPADFTFVCPTELKEMSDYYADFKEGGAEIFSISTDSAYVHKAWVKDNDLT